MRNTTTALLPEFINISEKQIETLTRYVELIAYWNATHNITADHQAQAVWGNIVDSVTPLEILPELKSTKKVLDIGSGAGFPAIPLAVMMLDSHFVLTEPAGKKSAFLHLVKTELKLDHVEVVGKRVEAVTGRAFDLITSRAVTRSADLVAISSHLLAPSGSYLLYKGERAGDEAGLIPKGFSATLHAKEKRTYLVIEGEGS